MISESKNFIFIHIPKTGGNSIQSILQKYSEDQIITKAKYQDGIERFEIGNKNYNYRKHAKLIDYKKELKPELYKGMFKFAVVRNPWDRLISYYFSPHRGIKEFDRNNFKKMINQIPILGYFTTEIKLTDRVKNKLGLNYKVYRSLDKDVDFYIRFENIEEDFKELCRKLDIPFESLPRYNKSEKNHYSSYYDNELIELVAKKFKQEIDFFKYEFEMTANQ